MKYGTNWGLLEKMCRLTGGRCYNDIGKLNENMDLNDVIPVMYNCRSVLVLVALFLFIIEIGYRRLFFKM